MSWAGLASNQCVSCNNLQDAVTNSIFTLKSTIPSSTKEITRSEAESYVFINPITSKSTNQLVVKSDLVAVDVYQIQISCDGTTSTLACSLSTYCIAYCLDQTPVFGTVFYANSSLTALYDFSGYSNIFIKVESFDNTTGYWKCRIDTTNSSVNNTPVSCP